MEFIACDPAMHNTPGVKRSTIENHRPHAYQAVSYFHDGAHKSYDFALTNFQTSDEQLITMSRKFAKAWNMDQLHTVLFRYITHRS
jgi:phage baseplate assembly protein gpV